MDEPTTIELPTTGEVRRSTSYAADKDRILNRLRRIEGQVRGVAQMVADGAPPLPRADEPHVTLLSDADATDMAALAGHAQPGPWGPATHRYGPFFGVRDSGRLLAMGGQRMLMPGMAEVSGVATWQDCRGRGLARTLIGHVMRAMVERGEQPFLHSYADNEGAIALYESLGFRIRRKVHVLVIAR